MKLTDRMNHERDAHGYLTLKAIKRLWNISMQHDGLREEYQQKGKIPLIDRKHKILVIGSSPDEMFRLYRAKIEAVNN